MGIFGAEAIDLCLKLLLSLWDDKSRLMVYHSKNGRLLLITVNHAFWDHLTMWLKWTSIEKHFVIEKQLLITSDGRKSQVLLYFHQAPLMLYKYMAIVVNWLNCLKSRTIIVLELSFINLIHYCLIALCE